MRRPFLRASAWLIAATVTSSAAAVAVASPPDPAPRGVADVAQRVSELTDAVLAHHIDPPPRQQMVLDGIKAAYQAAGVPAPAGLGRRVSAVATPAQLATFLAETWPRPDATAAVPEALESALAEGLLVSVDGLARLLPAREARVYEQLEGNLYVGIQIALAYDKKAELPAIAQVFEGGPAHKAGALADDLIESIDGWAARGRDLRQAVDRLRGEEGTDVVVTIRRPGSKEPKTLTLTRAILPRPTIAGIRGRASGDQDVRLEGPEPIGYLRFNEILGSTPHELRQWGHRLEREGTRALVLDLRGVHHAGLHPTVLLADSLLDGGTIGLVREAGRVTTYRADPDALFRGWPLAALVDSGTAGPAEWLAAALQDNHRAVLVGSTTLGADEVETAVPVASGAWSIVMTTRRLERGDGRPLGTPATTLPTISRLPRAALMIRQTPMGVKPDHALAGPPIAGQAGPRQRPVPAPANAPAVAPGPAPDLPLQKAIEVLQAALRSP